MRVLWFSINPCGSIKRGGSLQYFGGWIVSLEQELKRNPSIELSVSYITKGDDTSFDFDGVSYYPIKKTRFDNLITRIKGKHSFNIVPKCLEIITKVKPDIIHIHGTEHPFPLLVGNTNIPIVISMQSILAPYSVKYFSGIPKVFALKHDSLKFKLLFLGAYAMYRLTCNSAANELKAFKQLKYIIGRTDWDYCISRLIAPSSKYYKCDEILRDDFYQNQWMEQMHETLTLVTTMSDSLYKGLEVVYKTAELLKNYNVEVKWLIIGQSENTNYEKIVRKYTKVNPSNVNVKLLGRKGTCEMVKIMKESDIFIQVSHIENSPNSLCEAMILGMPIIASYAGGTSSLLNDNFEGLLYQDGDYYSLAGKILYLSLNKQLSVELGKNARKRAIERHNINRIVNQIIYCYKDMIQK